MFHYSTSSGQVAVTARLCFLTQTSCPAFRRADVIVADIMAKCSVPVKQQVNWGKSLLSKHMLL